MAQANDTQQTYEITVTNLTRGQIISPPVVATHNGNQSPIFTLGSPSSAELTNVAEDAVNDPLVNQLSASPNVKEVRAFGGPIMPGQTATMQISAGGNFNRLSMVGMLVTTNDAFFGLNGAPLPSTGRTAHSSPAYDAGSEANNESCAYIPGPPCGNPNQRLTAGAEGFVHVHAGIHGIGDLQPSDFDWRNPVAWVVIRRVNPAAN
jgi:hypothetical protein